MRALAVGLSFVSVLVGQDEAWTERRLATIPDGLELTSTATGPDGLQYTDHTVFVFGAGGRFVAYSAFRGGKGVAVVDERVLGEFDFLHQPVTDAAREHHAFRAGSRTGKDREQWWAIVDGDRGKAFAWIGEVAVGAGGVAAFWEQPGAKVQRDGAYNQGPMVFHCGARTTKKFDPGLGLSPPSFRADGKTVATLATRGGLEYPLVLEGKRERLEKRGLTSAEDIVLSPDGSRRAVVFADGGMPLPPGMPAPPGVTAGSWCIDLDGERLGGGSAGVGSPVFSPDSRHLAFKFQIGERVGIAIDDEKLPPPEHAFVGNPVFEAKGAVVMFAACEGGTVDDYARLRPWGEQSIRGGRWSLHRRQAKGKTETLVQDTEGLGRIVCHASGRYAYARQDAGKWRVVVGAVRSEPFDEVGMPEFAEDGRRVGFGARSGRELWWRILSLE